LGHGRLSRRWELRLATGRCVARTGLAWVNSDALRRRVLTRTRRISNYELESPGLPPAKRSASDQQADVSAHSDIAEGTVMLATRLNQTLRRWSFVISSGDMNSDARSGPRCKSSGSTAVAQLTWPRRRPQSTGWTPARPHVGDTPPALAVLRLRALVARTRGDAPTYRELVERYRALAAVGYGHPPQDGFEDHRRS
jgi:hypothetical protein